MPDPSGTLEVTAAAQLLHDDLYIDITHRACGDSHAGFFQIQHKGRFHALNAQQFICRLCRQHTGIFVL